MILATAESVVFYHLLLTMLNNIQKIYLIEVLDTDFQL